MEKDPTINLHVYIWTIKHLDKYLLNGNSDKMLAVIIQIDLSTQLIKTKPCAVWNSPLTKKEVKRPAHGTSLFYR